jgi:hypothetical protein
MSMTQYTGNTDIIANVGTTPQERGLTTDEFKAKFDEGLKAFVSWFNSVHKTQFDAHLADNAAHSVSSKAGQFTRDLSLEGLQVITGLGFRPKAVLFYTNAPGAGKMSLGFAAENAQAVLFDNYNGFANSWNSDIGKVIFIMEDAASNWSFAAVDSFDADGFTVNWAKYGTGATGTATINYIAIK